MLILRDGSKKFKGEVTFFKIKVQSIFMDKPYYLIAKIKSLK